MIHQHHIQIATKGRSSHAITDRVEQAIQASAITTGLCHLFLHHTSASLILCENADPQVRRDLEAFMSRLVVDGDPIFRHTQEGMDDMPAHIRSILTQATLTIPISQGRGALGTWQGIYLWEHRDQGQHRQITITIHGE